MLVGRALTFRDFVPRLELLALRNLLGIFAYCKSVNVSLFCKSCLVLFLTFFMALRFYDGLPQI